MSTLQIVLAIVGIVVPIFCGLLVIINKMHNGRVDALDKREFENNKIHLQNHRDMMKTITEERRIAEERDEKIFTKLDAATVRMADLAEKMAGHYVSKEDCGRCREG